MMMRPNKQTSEKSQELKTLWLEKNDNASVYTKYQEAVSEIRSQKAEKVTDAILDEANKLAIEISNRDFEVLFYIKKIISTPMYDSTSIINLPLSAFIGSVEQKRISNIS